MKVKNKLLLLAILFILPTLAEAADTQNILLKPDEEAVLELALGAVRKSLKIELDAGEVYVRGDEKAAEVNIKAVSLMGLSGDKLIVRNVGSMLSIKVKGNPQGRSRSFRAVSGGVVFMSNAGGDSSAVRIIITVPKKFLDDITIETRGATLTFDSMEDLGIIDINAGSSKSKFTDVQARKFNINVGSGASYFSNSRGDSKINSGSGKSEFIDFIGSMNINSGSGEFNATKTKGDISVRTGSGKITVVDNEGDTVDIHSHRGSISVVGQVGGEITLTSVDGSKIVTNNPQAKNQVVRTSRAKNYRDLSGKWANVEVLEVEQHANGQWGNHATSVASGVFVNGRVVSGEEAQMVQEQVMRSMASAFPGWSF